MLKIVGYADRFSVAPGETIHFMVSAKGGRRYRAGLVRIIHGDANPAGPGFKAEAVAAAFAGGYEGREQTIAAGSHVRVDHHAAFAGLGAFTIAAMVWPTTPGRGAQGIVTKWSEPEGLGVRLEVGERGDLAVTFGDGRSRATITTGKAMLTRRWYLVAASHDPAAGTVTLVQRPLEAYARTEDAAEVTATVDVTPTWPDAPLIIAGWGIAGARVGGHYNGKIDAPVCLDRALEPAELEALFLRPMPPAVRASVVAAWDFSRDIATTRAVDLGPYGLDGEVVNLPTRAMKGWSWTGEEHCWWRRPEHYGAIHFHDDDLYDAGWISDFFFTVPESMRSAVYAAHLVVEGADGAPEAGEDGTGEDYIPFAVRRPRGRAGHAGRPKLAVLLPTAAYMAYANHQEHLHAEPAEMVIGRLLVFQPTDLFFHEHAEYGASLYDLHSDGSGVAISSRLRPILNMRPKYSSWVGGSGSGLWQFNADTHLLDWLEHEGLDYDVITDEDLHAEGFEALAPYRCVVTGTHPEYYSTAMWDGMKAWLDRGPDGGGGGRLVYLAANGWYWRIAFHPELPGVIEVRRAEDGIRTWEAHPGEYFHAFNGEYGGLWRRIGRPPNLMCGVGFTAQGFDVSSYYERRAGSFDPRAAFIFEGIGADERIGDFGLVGGGAAGLELDRVEPALGSPPNTLILASSVAHSDLIALVNEEFTVVPPNLFGSAHPNVRADLAFFETPAGGAVLSVGSIAWCGALSHAGYANNVARITANVIRRFLDPTPFL